MNSSDQSTVRNRLLRLLSDEDFGLLSPYLVLEQMPKGTILFGKGTLLDTIWFPESGIGSLVGVSANGDRAGIGLVGREGFAPVPLVLGSDRAPYEAHLSVPDDCFRLEAAAFRDVVGQSPTLLNLLLRYALTLHAQMAHTALANALSSIEERLARWLLMCHDRGDTDEIELTHEAMSVMLAVRRPSVTTSLHVLEGNGLIRSERGRVIVRDRAGLEAFAGDSYGAPEREYERLIGPLR